MLTPSFLNAAVPTPPVALAHTALIPNLQQGFSLIEVSIVTAIVLLLAIIGVPAIGGYVVENKVPKVGEELARFVLQTKVNGPNGSTTPYAGISIDHFANLVSDSSIFTVDASGGQKKVYHGLGNKGEVKIAEATAGAAFTVTLDKVNNAACPSIASVMQRIVEEITVDGSSGSTTVKSSTVGYNALTVEAACSKGDVNTFAFTVG